MTYLKFIKNPRLRERATDTWDVTNLNGMMLGVIMWATGWRKYCFFPMENTQFDPSCLREIADFCAHETEYR